MIEVGTTIANVCHISRITRKECRSHRCSHEAGLCCSHLFCPLEGLVAQVNSPISNLHPLDQHAWPVRRSFPIHQRRKDGLNHGLDSEAGSFLSIDMPPHSVTHNKEPEYVSCFRECPLQSENAVFLGFPRESYVQGNGGIEREIGRTGIAREFDRVIQREQSVLYLTIGKRCVRALQKETEVYGHKKPFLR